MIKVEELIGPHAYGGPILTGKFKSVVDDFQVTESLGYEPSGEGEHIYCFIEKQNLNTEQIASRLAVHAGLSRKQVNYAGLKDKIGVTKQWFSVHMPGKETPDFSAIEDENIRVLIQKRHLKKLQRGALQGNHFNIRLREISGDIDGLAVKLTQLKQGFPNYFAEQRFGYQGQNIEKAKGLFFEKQKIKNKALKGLILSAARSWLFNRQLALRVQDNTWNRLIEGDFINICGSNSVFVEPTLTETLISRADKGELVPAGLLWGQCQEPKFTEQYEYIREQLHQQQPWLEALETRGLEIMPRPFVCMPEGLEYDQQGKDLLLSFFLRKGSYATSLLRELFRMVEVV